VLPLLAVWVVLGIGTHLADARALSFLHNPE
jgi:hypothetical protein